VTLHRLGFTGTGAGVDMSNAADRTDPHAVLLPLDPDASARHIRERLRELTGATVAVIISDSFGSANREGAYGAAIGIAGIRHLEEPGRDADLFGNPSKPVMNRVDEIASAASILMGQTAAARPVIIARGVPYTTDDRARLSRLLIEPEPPASSHDTTTLG
jgi:coenzyme F420-0:L-glutamate ligase / coenzyme F420-1:gamma-L-glutamate ligase